MGQEIDIIEFSDEDRVEFKKRLREETKILKRWFDHDELETPETSMLGLEVEAWLVDENFLPNPANDLFLKTADHPLLVHELSQFNFEINVDPVPLSGGCFSSVANQLKKIWSTCRNVGGELNMAPALFGILPTVRDEMLCLDYMTKSNRYRALNEQMFHLRKNAPMRIQIERKGKNRFGQTRSYD